MSTESTFPQVRGGMEGAAVRIFRTLSAAKCVYVHTPAPLAADARMVQSGHATSRGAWGTVMLNALVLSAAVAALLVWGGREVQSPWGETQGPAFSQAQIAQWSQAVVDEQVSALGCDTTPALTETVAVRNAVGFDRGVVRVVSFDEGFALGQAGKVFVVGWSC